MSSVWAVGNHVKVEGMPDDFKILSYNFIVGGSVEMILESTKGSRYFLKRRKTQVFDIHNDNTFDLGSNVADYGF